MDRSTLGMRMDRRRLLAGSGAVLASTTWPVRAAETGPGTDITGRYVVVVAKARARDAAGNVAVGKKTYVLRR